VNGLRAWRDSVASHQIHNQTGIPNSIAMAMPKGQEAAQPATRRISWRRDIGPRHGGLRDTGRRPPREPVSWDGSSISRPTTDHAGG